MAIEILKADVAMEQIKMTLIGEISKIIEILISFPFFN